MREAQGCFAYLILATIKGYNLWSGLSMLKQKGILILNKVWLELYEKKLCSDIPSVLSWVIGRGVLALKQISMS